MQRHPLPDGGSITVAFDGVTPVITIDTAPAVVQQPTPALFNLWMPRGFAVFPCWGDATGGVGLPVIEAASSSTYDSVNLAPGVAKARWTPGGACGDVLVSPDVKAGYAINTRDIAVPLLYDATKGPVFRWPGDGMFDARKPDGAWTSYRLERVLPVDNYGDESAAEAIDLFEQVNAARAAAGAQSAELPTRGAYRPAKTMTSIMQAAGSTDATSAGYPATYADPSDRLAKDGYRALRLGQSFSAWSRSDNLMGVELRHLGGVADAIATWEADGTAGPALVDDYGASPVLDTGARGGYLCAALNNRDRWLQAGNQCWIPADPGLPPLSWMGFASLNLAWETFPAVYDPGSTSEPIIPSGSFTDTNGDCWLNYARTTTAAASSAEPAMSRHIFCRGRAIATTPRGGLVWGACAQSVVLEQGTVDRLIAIVHHPEDQGAATDGPVRYLRVWWADIPRRNHLRLDPQLPIAGEDASDAWGWRGGDLVDLGLLPAPGSGFQASAGVNSLKYASQWRFHPHGVNAICLRDYGAQADYQLSAIGNVVSLDSNHVRAVELTFDCTPTGVTTSMQAHGYAGGQAGAPAFIPGGKPPLSGDTLLISPDSPAPIYDTGTYPLAVDYAADGSIRYAYSVTLISSWAALDTGTAQHLSYTYVGTGSAAAATLAGLEQPILHGVNFKTPAQNFQPVTVLVLDVNRGAFAALGMQPRFQVDTSQLTSMDGPEGGYGGPVASTTPTSVSCPVFTADPVDGVRLARSGQVLDESWYPNPDGALWFAAARCGKPSDPRQVTLYRAVSHSVQGFHAERFGEHVVGYQVSPMPGAALVAGSLPSDATCGCEMTVAALAGGVSLHLLTHAELSPRGGVAAASVPLPACDWLAYAKVL